MMDSAYLSDYLPENHITMSEEQRRWILRGIEMDAAELQNGIDNKDHNLVGHVLDDLTYITKSKNNWFCHSCPFKRSCDGYDSRYQLGQFPEDIEIINKLILDYRPRNL